MKSYQTFHSKCFSNAIQHKKRGWQIHNPNQQIKLNATMIKNVLTSLIQTQFHLSLTIKLTPMPTLNPLDNNPLSESYNLVSLRN